MISSCALEKPTLHVKICCLNIYPLIYCIYTSRFINLIVVEWVFNTTIACEVLVALVSCNLLTLLSSSANMRNSRVILAFFVCQFLE